MAVVTRTAAWRSEGPADGWTEELRWYAAGIHRMRALTPRLDDLRSITQSIIATRMITPQQQTAANTVITGWTDPRGLGYQSQVHDTFMPRTLWPTRDGARVLWAECAHSNWFFLPWHRAYLLEFEDVVRSHVRDLGGPADTWALPYWNSSDYARLTVAADLPLPLRSATLPAGVDVPGVPAGPDGTRPNPLFEASRRMTGSSGLGGATFAGAWPDASDALSRRHYATAEDFDFVSFGGGYLEDLTRFHSASEGGQLDDQPHGSGHVRVGGFMSLFQTAGLDPVFWMHHANVDRLWETYARDLRHGYPFPNGRPAGALAGQAFDSWTGTPFRFLRPDGTVKVWRSPELLDVEALGYRYDTTAAPRILPLASNPPGQDVDPFGLAPGESVPVAAASAVSVAATTEVVLEGGGPGEEGTGAAEPGARWHVRFDGIRASAPAVTSYEVYLGLAPDAAADPTDLEHFLGLLSLFGVFEASREELGSLGQRRLLEATGAVAAQPALDPLHAPLRLVPTEPDRPVDAVGLTVDRISLVVAVS